MSTASLNGKNPETEGGRALLRARKALEASFAHLGKLADLVALLARNNVRLTKVAPLSSTLEDLYFALRKERAGS